MHCFWHMSLGCILSVVVPLCNKRDRTRFSRYSDTDAFNNVMWFTNILVPLFYPCIVISDDQLICITWRCFWSADKMLSYTAFVILSFFSAAFTTVIHYQPEAVHLSYGGKFCYNNMCKWCLKFIQKQWNMKCVLNKYCISKQVFIDNYTCLWY